MKFEDLKFEQHPSFPDEGAIQAYAKLDNGYEVSVIRGGLSYGKKDGLWEIGVFDALGRMRDPLGWGDTVKGWLTEEDVEKELDLIASL